MLWRAAFAALVAQHRRRPFHVLHAFWANESGLLAAMARLLGVPTVVSLAGGETVALPDIGYGGWLRASERARTCLAVALAATVTAGSPYQVSLAEARLRRRGRTAYLPLGVAEQRFRPAGAGPQAYRAADDEPPEIVHVASLAPVKDQVTLLRAAALLQARGTAFRLRVVGDGEACGELRATVARLGLGERVRFTGAVPHDRLPVVYAVRGVVRAQFAARSAMPRRPGSGGVWPARRRDGGRRCADARARGGDQCAGAGRRGPGGRTRRAAHGRRTAADAGPRRERAGGGGLRVAALHGALPRPVRDPGGGERDRAGDGVALLARWLGARGSAGACALTASTCAVRC